MPQSYGGSLPSSFVLNDAPEKARETAWEGAGQAVLSSRSRVVGLTMCGIAGYASPRPQPPDLLEAMSATLRHRGPDSDGFHRRGPLGLAIRRLRIIDLVTGDQPITSACSGATIVYNGELYNYRELRTELEAKGHIFKTKADTEVVLHFYEEFGIDAFGRLNGIFAFALDDPRKDRLVLGRDHLGVKPLYYVTRPDGSLIFASEPKALLAVGVIAPRPDPAALVSYLTYGHATGTSSFFSGVIKLPPAHALTWTPDGAMRLERFWHPLAAARRWGESGPGDDEVGALVVDAVRRNMLADVPVGVFLSGGLDSSVVAALMHRETGRTLSYSVGFGGTDDERGKAQRVATVLGTEHTEIIVTPEDAGDTIDRLAAIYDEPFADAASLPTYLMAKRAREDVTVVLTGEGGDELFGGYRRYVAERAHAAYSFLPHRLRELARDSGVSRAPRFRRLSATLRALAEDDRHVRYPTWTESFSLSERRRLVGHDGRDRYEAYARVVDELATVRDGGAAIMAAELQTWLVDGYLEKVDKATMATSLEARVPLLDPRLVELLLLAPTRSKISGLQTKVQMRRIAARYLPAEIVGQPKRGFTPPVGEWLRTVMSHEVSELGMPGNPLSDLLDPGTVRQIVSRFESGQGRHEQVWSLLILERWAARYLRSPQPAAAGYGPPT